MISNIASFSRLLRGLALVGNVIKIAIVAGSVCDVANVLQTVRVAILVGFALIRDAVGVAVLAITAIATALGQVACFCGAFGKPGKLTAKRHHSANGLTARATTATGRIVRVGIAATAGS